jgi:hypothetical protein
MPSDHHYDQTTDQWIYFGSLSKVGGFHLPANEQVPETRFYAIDGLTSSDPTWKQSDQVIVNPGRDDIYVPGNEKSVYIISRQYGTLDVPFGSFGLIKRDEL